MLKGKAGTYRGLSLLLALSGLKREEGSQSPPPSHTHQPLCTNSLLFPPVLFPPFLFSSPSPPALHFITFGSLCLFQSLLSRSLLFSSFPLSLLLSLLMSTLPALFESLICVRLDSKQFTCINSFYSSQLPCCLFSPVLQIRQLKQ